MPGNIHFSSYIGVGIPCDASLFFCLSIILGIHHLATITKWNLHVQGFLYQTLAINHTGGAVTLMPCIWKAAIGDRNAGLGRPWPDSANQFLYLYVPWEAMPLNT